MKFLTANFRSPRGEIDLVFRDADCLVFIEVKTRSSEDWVRPAAAVDKDGNVRPLEAPGIGVEVNEDFLSAHPPIEGPGYV